MVEFETDQWFPGHIISSCTIRKSRCFRQLKVGAINGILVSAVARYRAKLWRLDTVLKLS